MERRTGMSLVLLAMLAVIVAGAYWQVAPREGEDVIEAAALDDIAPLRQPEAPTIAAPPLPQAPVATSSIVIQMPDKQPRRSSPDKREILAQLEETCRYWSQKTGVGASKVMRESACNRMQAYARENSLAVARINAPPVRRAPHKKRSGTDDLLRQYEKKCDRLGYRSTEYRRCRAEAKDSLKQKCEVTREKLSGARGAAYLTLKEQASEICSASRRYMIVD